MYKTAIECYQKPVEQSIEYSHYKGPVVQEPVKHVNTVNTNTKTNTVNTKTNTDKQGLSMSWKTTHHVNMSDPTVWGPAFWFTLHNGASKYAINASPVTIDRMKAYIIGIPSMLPCAACKIHADNHILENSDNLDDICSGREKLFKFFVDFHNTVNRRYNKSEMSIEDAYKLYTGKVGVNTLSYQ